jgi:hypothetical protein
MIDPARVLPEAEALAFAVGDDPSSAATLDCARRLDARSRRANQRFPVMGLKGRAQGQNVAV